MQCWGNGEEGKLGHGKIENAPLPVEVIDGKDSVAPLKNIRQISIGTAHSCALNIDGEVRCWGAGRQGILGNGKQGDKSYPYPVTVLEKQGSDTPLRNIVQISAGGNHTCAVNVDKELKCWGSNDFGQLGVGEKEVALYPTFVLSRPGLTTSLQNVEQVSAGLISTCALLTSGEVKCWGSNEHGRLGNGNTDSQYYPVSVLAGGDLTTPLKDILHISTGRNYACAVTSQGEVKCWGRGTDGQLGNGQRQDQLVPVTVIGGEGLEAPLRDIVEISANGYHTCALSASGGIKCWGQGFSGTLGNGKNESTSYPVEVVENARDTTGVQGVQAISVGLHHTCAINSKYLLQCWGDGRNQNLGTGSISNRFRPTSVINSEDQPLAIQPSLTIPNQRKLIGESFSYEITDENISGAFNGQSTTFTLSSDGGSGIILNENTLSHPTGFTEVASYTVSGILSYAQGASNWSFTIDVEDDEAPQLNIANQSIYVEENFSYTLNEASDISRLRQGETYTITVADDAGLGVSYDSTTKTFLGNIQSPGVGTYVARGSISDEYGNKSAWSFTIDISLQPVELSINDNFPTGTLGVGNGYTCAITTQSGNVQCWGLSFDGRLGNHDLSNTSVRYPTYVLNEDSTPLSGAVQLSVGFSHSCIITNRQEVQCWGQGGSGQLGNGEQETLGYAVTVVESEESSQPLGNVIQIEAGVGFTCALISGGQVKCWGSNPFGRLGYGSTAPSNYPVTVVDGSQNSVPLSGVTQITLGNHHGCALTVDGQVKCWGKGQLGVLGHGSYQGAPHTVTVIKGQGLEIPLSQIVQVDAGERHTCALNTSGQVLCWGSSEDYQLGNGSTQTINYPTHVISEGETPLSGIVRIGIGQRTSCALTQQSQVKCWGRGAIGQLGHGRFVTSSSLPVLVVNGESRSGPLKRVIHLELSPQGAHACILTALTQQSQVKCWGRGAIGQLGHGRFVTSSSLPVLVVNGESRSGPLKRVIHLELSPQGAHACILTAERNIKCWGRGASGELGHGRLYFNRDYPVTAVSAENAPPLLIPLTQN